MRKAFKDFKVSRSSTPKVYNNPFLRKRGRKPNKPNFEMHFSRVNNQTKLGQMFDPKAEASQRTLYFKIYWSKQVYKKHKSWEDGIMTVEENRRITIKDLEGKYVYKCFKPKNFFFVLDQ